MFYKFLLPFILLVFSYNTMFAQFGHSHFYHPAPSYSSYNKTGKKRIKRGYMSAGLPLMSLEMDSHLTLDRSKSQSYNTPGISVDTSIFLNTRCTGSYGFSVGTFYPLFKINDHQMIALDFSYGGYVYKFDFGPVKYSPSDVVKNIADFYLFEFPFIFQYKSGGEVNLDPSKKVLFSVGAGFAPTITLGGYNSAGGVLFKTRSLIMAEVGLFFGVAAKVRFTYYPGTLVLIDDTQDGLTLPNNYGTFTVNAFGSGNFVMSVIFLHHSRHWGDDVY